MLLYNTTFHIEEDIRDSFLIWLKEAYIHEVIKSGLLTNPRLYKVLSHKEPGHESYCLQWDVDNSSILHQWHSTQGAALNEEIPRIFKDKVLCIPTLMEAME